MKTSIQTLIPASDGSEPKSCDGTIKISDQKMDVSLLLESDIPQTGLDSRSALEIKIKSPHSTIVGAEALLEQIKNDSYKWEYLGFWECLWSSIKDFINHLFGYESHCVLTCFIEKIKIDEKMVDFVTLVFSELLQEINFKTLQNPYFRLPQETVNENQVASMAGKYGSDLVKIISSTGYLGNLARTIFDEIHDVKDNRSGKESLEKFFGDVIMKEMRKNDNLKQVIENNLPNRQNLEKENKKRMEFLEFLSTKCGNDPSLNITFSSYVITIDSRVKNETSESLRENFKNIVRSIISNSDGMIKKESTKVDNGEIPSKAYQEFLENIYAIAPNEKINGSTISDLCLKIYALKFIKPNLEILNDGIKILRDGKLPENSKFWKVLRDICEIFVNKEGCKEKFGFDPNEAMNLMREYYMFKEIKDPESLPGIDLLCAYAPGIANALKLKKDKGPMISEKDFEKISSGLQEIVSKAVTDVLNSKVSNPEEQNSEKWKNFKNSWDEAKTPDEKLQILRDIRCNPDLNPREIGENSKFDEEVYEGFLEILEKSDLFRGMHLNYDPQKEGSIGGIMMGLAEYLVSRNTNLMTEMVNAAGQIRGEELGNFANAMGNAYIEHLQGTGQLPHKETQQ